MRRGMSLIEVLIAASVLSTVLLGMAMFQVSTMKGTHKERDRTFAVQKAVQMMEEVLAAQTTRGTSTDAGIDTLDDGGNYSYVLTIDPKVTNPTAAISGNLSQSGHYRYVRQISVATLPNDKRSRRVTINVYLAGNSNTASPSDPNSALATVTNIVKSDVQKSLPVQVYDLYVIKIENMASWWGDSNILEDSVQNTINALQTNNPGLQFRTHWIRRLAYGRDPYYAPYVNKSQNIAADPGNWVYFYPGKKDADTNVMEPDSLGGQMLLDGAKANDLSVTVRNTSQGRYTFADQFNHGLRAPQEAAKQAQAGGELTLRGLLDSLADGSKLKNAIVLNLHSENLPIPPIRNYADPAKVPQHHNKGYVKSTFGVDAADNNAIDDGARCRLVAHPRRLYVSTSNSTDYPFDDTNTVDLHVYPYLTSNVTAEPGDASYRSGRVVLRGVANNLYDFSGENNSQRIEIDICQRVAGGQGESFNYQTYPTYTGNGYGNGYGNNGNGNGNYTSTTGTIGNQASEYGYYWERVWPPHYDEALDKSLAYSDDLKNRYHISVTEITNDQANKDLYDNDLQIKWDNLPFTHQQVSTGSGNDGLAAATTLYGYNYFPDPLLPYLTSSWSSAQPRNTARMRIRFKLKNAQTVETLTSMGAEDDMSHHQAPNASVTYCYVGTNVPFSEKFQFMGDPRHNPYLDLRNAERYNRCFADLTSNAYNVSSGASWNSFDDTANGWSGKKIDIDIDRFHEYWRQALFAGNTEFVNPGGWSFYYYSIGGEFADNGAALTVPTKPYTGSAGTAAYDEMGYSGQSYLATNAGNTWFAKPWLGELYPDDQWDSWRDFGNLPSSGYRRKSYSAVTTWQPGGAGAQNFDRKKALNEQGAVSFFNGGSNSGGTNWFTHLDQGGHQGAATSQGTTLSASYNLPVTDSFAASRPFVINNTTSSNKPTNWGLGDVQGWRNLLEWGLNPSPYGYYSQDDNATYQDAAPIILRRGSDAGYVLILGTEKASTQADADAQSRVALMSALEGFFDSGKSTYSQSPTTRGNEAMKLLPRVSLTAPADDTALSGSQNIAWQVDWQRWNTQPYSNQVSNYNTNTYRPYITYNLKFSKNGGASWNFVDSPGTTAQVGVYASNHALTGSSYNWNTGSLHSGDYLIRLEAYRMQSSGSDNGYSPVHYAYHQLGVYK